MRVLAVEDEADLAELLRVNLARHGFATDIAATVADAKAYLRSARYDIALVDRRLPDGDGLTLLGVLRSTHGGVPVIAVTARDSLQDRLDGLNGGADDYIIKPFAIEELLARMNAVLRRPGGALGVVLSTGDLSFNTVSREVRVRDAVVVLPRRELAILELLMRAAGRVVTRDKMLDGLYAFDDEPSSNAVDANVSRLRRRLREAPSTAEIQVIRGIGYLLRSVQ